MVTLRAPEFKRFFRTDPSHAAPARVRSQPTEQALATGGDPESVRTIPT